MKNIKEDFSIINKLLGIVTRKSSLKDRKYLQIIHGSKDSFELIHPYIHKVGLKVAFEYQKAGGLIFDARTINPTDLTEDFMLYGKGDFYAPFVCNSYSISGYCVDWGGTKFRAETNENLIEIVDFFRFGREPGNPLPANSPNFFKDEINRRNFKKAYETNEDFIYPNEVSIRFVKTDHTKLESFFKSIGKLKSKKRQS